MAAGQAIAFEGTAANRMWYDGTLGVLRWTNGVYTHVLGRGITVGFQSVFGTVCERSRVYGGEICFLVGSSPMTMTLPAASAIPAGVGYTFSNFSSAAVGIVPSGTNTIDCGTVILQPNDRYHVISDGTSCWREVRGGRLGRYSVSPPISGSPAGWLRNVSSVGSSRREGVARPERRPNRQRRNSCRCRQCRRLERSRLGPASAHQGSSAAACVLKKSRYRPISLRASATVS